MKATNLCMWLTEWISLNFFFMYNIIAPIFNLLAAYITMANKKSKEKISNLSSELCLWVIAWKMCTTRKFTENESQKMKSTFVNEAHVERIAQTLSVDFKSAAENRNHSARINIPRVSNLAESFVQNTAKNHRNIQIDFDWLETHVLEILLRTV